MVNYSAIRDLHVSILIDTHDYTVAQSLRQDEFMSINNDRIA